MENSKVTRTTRTKGGKTGKKRTKRQTTKTEQTKDSEQDQDGGKETVILAVDKPLDNSNLNALSVSLHAKHAFLSPVASRVHVHSNITIIRHMAKAKELKELTLGSAGQWRYRTTASLLKYINLLHRPAKGGSLTPENADLLYWEPLSSMPGHESFEMTGPPPMLRHGSQRLSIAAYDDFR
jgi:hypothetical protein